MTEAAQPAIYAEIAVAVPLDDTFTYAVPEGMHLTVGHAVSVPFGNRRETGYVVALRDHCDREQLKAVDRLLDPEPVFAPDQLNFFRWIAEYYLASLGEVISTALPSAYRGRSRRVFQPTELGIDALAAEASDPASPLRAGRRGLPESLAPAQATLLREVVARPGRTRRGLQQILHGEVEAEEVGKALDSLSRRGLVRLEEQQNPDPGGKVVTVALAQDPEQSGRLRGALQRAVLARLIEAGGAMDLAELVAAEGESAAAAVSGLVRKGVLKKAHREDRDPFAEGEAETGPPPSLNADQQHALEALLSPDSRTWLLHGVTGSGKTEVYLQAAESVLADGRQVMVLVPEISLTPQLCARFRGRFGERIAVLHSGLSPAARLREWRRIRAGEAQVAIGARSALFAPFHKLGLIVVDEEHDDSYKQDEGVRYNARDLAVVLGKLVSSPVVLGSATPSLESWHNASVGRYGLLRLPHRATPRAVPRVELLDLRGRPADTPLAGELVTTLESALDAGGKAIVLYNRRGYAPVVECPSCGAHYACPSCGVGMVYHRNRKRVSCHYCGFFQPFTPDCPVCGAAFAVLGHGTERVEEALGQALPGVGIARMDADATTTKGSHHRILKDFRTGKVRLLVGTQLVAKGHDFPDVHVAAVVGVDHILMLPDFRSVERTWALVTQLAGRAGRGQQAGRVLVQTRHADHFVFRLLAGAEPGEDLDAFYTEEARQRRILAYPPFTRLVLVRLEGADREATWKAARDLAATLRTAGDPRGDRVDVLGPETAAMQRLVGRWRFQIVLRGRDAAKFRRWLSSARPLLRAAGRAGVRVIVDVDPRNLL